MATRLHRETGYGTPHEGCPLLDQIYLRKIGRNGSDHWSSIKCDVTPTQLAFVTRFKPRSPYALFETLCSDCKGEVLPAKHQFSYEPLPSRSKVPFKKSMMVKRVQRPLAANPILFTAPANEFSKRPAQKLVAPQTNAIMKRSIQVGKDSKSQPDGVDPGWGLGSTNKTTAVSVWIPRRHLSTPAEHCSHWDNPSFWWSWGQWNCRFRQWSQSHSCHIFLLIVLAQSCTTTVHVDDQ